MTEDDGRNECMFQQDAASIRVKSYFPEMKEFSEGNRILSTVGSCFAVTQCQIQPHPVTELGRMFCLPLPETKKWYRLYPF